MNGTHIREMQAEVREVEVSRPVREYLAKILLATRGHPQLVLGVSSRGGVHLQRAAQALAALRGEGFIAPQHIKAVAVAVLAHRIIAAPNSPLSPQDLVSDIVDAVPVPL